jgi:hypothetical protein
MNDEYSKCPDWVHGMTINEMRRYLGLPDIKDSDVREPRKWLITIKGLRKETWRRSHFYEIKMWG